LALKKGQSIIFEVIFFAWTLTPISFEGREILTKIYAGPSGREVTSLQEVDSLLIFLNVMAS
jgi:hypothetical protein